ncbi:hypothetical protein EKK58_00705 [Candidatus Dependentiae bacterium]|nr:MAG: hypothetical protein EKK58_00705 [Candidatus Dependentiae bacterium]
MKTFESFQSYLRVLRALPEVRSLVNDHPLGELLLEGKFADAMSEAFSGWYEARTYKALCPEGEDNAYPGDRAAFSLAMKAAFFKYRYAWPKVALDRALEAVARSLPPVEEVDGYDEVQPFVRAMRTRLTAAGSPIRALAQALKSITGGNGDEPTPGCDCPRCTALRQRDPSDASTEQKDTPKPDDALMAGMPPELRELLDKLGGALNEPVLSPRQQILQQASEIRAAIAAGRIQDVVNETFASLPPNIREPNIQAGLTIIAELGYGDIVAPYVEAARINGRFADFTATPEPGSPAEERYLQVLAAARRQLAE